jgi:photosystem II stability/assembly factor-like uncharacterized protein
MRKLYFFLGSIVLCIALYFTYQQFNGTTRLVPSREEEEGEGYDGPAQRDSLEFEKTKDPALGYVPTMRLNDAIDFTENQKKTLSMARSNASSLGWTERGPIYDSVGPSNGNGRGGGVGVTGAYTSGRIRAVFVDTLNDPTGNTVLAGGVAGGLWRTTNFLSDVPNWQPIDDRFDNMALSSIAQDPSNPNILYFATGEATSNADAVYGFGIWKSTDKGYNWTRLASTGNFIRNFKIACDAAGNIYLATRVTTTPVAQPYGLMRSKDQGATWQNITPAPHSLTTNVSCTDIEISSTGKLHASFGYLGNVVNHRYTSDPANVTPTTWSVGSGIRKVAAPAIRMELATVADTLYAVTVNASYYADSLYKSIDGGATWTKQNANALPLGVTNPQGWYNLTLTVNPANSNEIVVGGLDAYRSVNGGATVSKITNWVSSMPYVHADHHYMEWWNTNGESRLLIGCDGGLFLSRDAGATWKDKNRNLGIKQFYSAAIHPEAGSNYLLAGAQDNGVHQLKNPGLSYSTEVTGGDGAFVHINQKNPQIQFGSYVYNSYRRSTNGGQTWTGITWSNSAGMFINPFDYDDNTNTMYASWSANQLLRWMNAHNSTNNAILISLPNLGTASAVKVSESVAGRVFVGSNTGRLYRLDQSLTTPVITNITGASFPAGFLNCLNTGSSDDVLVAVFSNYGVNNVWHSTNGGTSWTAIDGNLPDMPIRWATFFPGHDDKLIIATETGVYSTQKTDGANTVWTPDRSYPTVRTDMLKVRKSDGAIVAATHGRGLYTAMLPTSFGPEVNFTTSASTITEGTASSIGCRGYRDYTVNVSLDLPATGDATAVFAVQSGTAQKGIDFDFTTNGDFTNPSDRIVFASGTSSVKPVTIRVYDDAEVEAVEEVILGLTVEGKTTATDGYNKTYTLTINDIDKAPQVNGLHSYAVGTYNVDIIATSPFASNKLKHKMQALYTAAELKALGLLPNSNIQGITLNVLVKNSNKPFKGLTVALANTTTSTLSAGYTTAPFTNVYTGDYSTVNGANTIDFTTPFVWDGVSNIAIQYCFDNLPDSSLTSADVLEGSIAPLGVGVRASTYSNHTVAPATPSTLLPGCSQPAASVSDARANVIFHATGGNGIATALNTQKTEYFHVTNDLYYYASNNEVVARLKNLSGNDFACTKVLIERAGTGASKFWNSNKNNFLMDKAFEISSAANTESGEYEVTLYYTKEEKEGWERITGQSWENIQLVRVSGKISGVTPANSQPNNNGTVKEVVNAIKGTYGTGYTLTGTFNGFGSIGAGMPGRQFTVLTVKADNSQGSMAREAGPSGIQIDWSTSSETNAKYFDVEKSYDGVTFKKIGTVKASGNREVVSRYSFVDTDHAEVNYYRIRLVHKGSNDLLSNTVRIKNANAVQQVFVLTNPFRNNIRLRFGKVLEAPAPVAIYDMQGKLVKRYTAPAGSNTLSIDMSGNALVPGLYDLNITINGKSFKTKLVKE